MGVILLFVVLGLSVALPVHCHQEGQYKIECLKMRGHIEKKGDELLCTLDPEEKK